MNIHVWCLNHRFNRSCSLFAQDLIVGDYALWEYLCDGHLRRPIHLSEYLLNTTITLWDERVSAKYGQKVNLFQIWSKIADSFQIWSKIVDSFQIWSNGQITELHNIWYFYPGHFWNTSTLCPPLLQVHKSWLGIDNNELKEKLKMHNFQSLPSDATEAGTSSQLV